MTAELRLRELKKTWTQIQQLREEKRKATKQMNKCQKIVRKLSQEIPVLLDKFNENMV